MVLDGAFFTVTVKYCVGVGLALVALSLCVVMISVAYSNSMSVDMENVVSCSVMFAIYVSTITWLRPCRVVEMFTEVVRVADFVMRDVFHTSYW